MANRHLITLAPVVLLVVLILGLVPGPVAVLGDDPGSKISGSLELLIWERAGQRELLLRSTGPTNLLLPAETGLAKVFIYLDRPPDAAVTAGLQSAGATVYADSWIPPVGLHPRGFVTASVPLDSLSGLAGLSYVAKIDSAETASQPQNDLAAVSIGTQAYWPTGYNGSGVRIAVLDSGLDTTFPDIPTPFAAKDYSRWPILGDNVTSPVIGAGAHGTHVTGSALGRGTLSGGRYKGMAYGSELVFLKIGNDDNAASSDDVEVAAIKAAVDIYQANVINMSYGGWSAHHDGTSAASQAVDYATSKGATVCISAGNEADKGKHYSGILQPSASIKLPIVITGSNGSNCTLRHNLVWWDGVGVHDNMTMWYEDANNMPLQMQSTPRDESVRGTEQQNWWWGTVPSQWSFIPQGDYTYGVVVNNNSNNERQFHLYFTGMAQTGADVRFQSPINYYTLGSPGEADSAITSGAYTTRTTWTDFRGYSHMSDETIDTVATFSSRGPRVDPGAPQKPTIVSPGSEIISCRDRGNYPVDNLTISDNGINNGTQPANYLVMEGTSMASPVTAGLVAILMQAYPGFRINPGAVKNLLERSATRYSTPDNNWGYGLVNLQRVLQMMPQSATVASSTGQGSLLFRTSAGTISNARALVASDLGSSCAAVLFPYGVFAFDISSILPGSSVDITITMPDSRATLYWKCTPNGPVQMPLVSQSGNSMVIRLTDGGPGDADGLANGVIVDPGGPGLPLVIEPAELPTSIAAPVSSPVSPPRSSSSVAVPVMQPIMLPRPDVTTQSAAPGTMQAQTPTGSPNEGDVSGESFVIAVMAALMVAIGVVIIMLWRRRRAY